jgi:hypothetical protein
MAEIRINTTGGLKLYDADNSHYAQIVAGTITSNVDAITLGHDTVTIADNLSLGSDSAVLKFGADSDVTVTHDPDDGLFFKSAATGDDNPFLLTLQTGETDLAANDVIGKISFQAPDEATGTDAILVSAAIQARAEGDHSSSSNATSIDFLTGASEAAAKKLSITSAGHFIPSADNTNDIGTASLEFKDGYFDGTLHCDVLDLAGTEYTSIPSLAGIDDQTSSNDDQITISDTAVIINEDSDDLDFRVESNGNANMLFISGGNNVVGVGAEGSLGVGIHITGDDGAISGASVETHANEFVIVNNGNAGMSIISKNDSASIINFGDAEDNNIGLLKYDNGDNSMRFITNNEEHVRFAGATQAINFNYGGTSITGNVAVHVEGQASATSMSVKHKDAGGGTAIAFTDGDNQACGSISVDGSANTTAYNTSSDYRLKENINYDFDATTEIKKLKPAKFNWKNNPDITLEGFLAHEVSSIVPIAVQGDKDATETKQKVVLGKNGNLWQYGIEEDEFDRLKVKWNAQTENVDEELKGATWHAEKVLPKYQSIDASKLVPLLVKTVQELEARITTLEG